MLLRQRVKAALPNTQKQTRGGCQNQQTKKHGPNERTNQNSRKRANQNGDKQSPCFKILVIRMLKEISEDLNSIRKIQSETKDTLMEIKDNLQGNNSGVDESENEINDVEHKEAKNNQSKQEEKEFKKMRIV